ncbi:3-methyladenine DNA glycosylase [Micromonospora zingiberis]|uniref:3-methyladenine DNA glycosylase n=1 Tax=Micromonospora zingiberis TaxID=2053011 RepID=A0A4V2LW83_9ACTN|nr:3-methyladenine DNA glycosylase [Micromonospora zingiberis]TCB95555.1 3-methyladenine DNA glycosylase [Micromonospora zingiberis]
MTSLPATAWLPRVRAHEERADSLTAGHRSRKAAKQRHAIDDFLYDYYGTRPAVLRRWHPGVGVRLEPGPHGPAPHGRWRWYASDPDGTVGFDAAAFLVDRADSVRFIRRLLSSISTRPAFTGCFGLHEWAMVYRQREHRHPLPLRLGQQGTDAVVEAHQIRCSHFDAFRFFTPDAVDLNRLRPTRASQVDLDQPGCLHAAMDCHKWATKLGPAVPGELALDCFELARDIRLLDMQASPYDLSAYGEPAVAIETPEGKAEYVARQREFSQRSGHLRARLIDVCTALLDAAEPPAMARV